MLAGPCAPFDAWGAGLLAFLVAARVRASDLEQLGSVKKLRGISGDIDVTKSRSI